MVIPLQTPHEVRTQVTFRSLMYALCYPGRVYPLEMLKLGLEAVAETLLDLETGYYIGGDAPALADFLQRTGSRRLEADQARYHFYPRLTESDLRSVRQAPIGTLLFPDEAATVVIAAKLGTGTRLRLTGPGIMNSAEVRVDGLPARFWEVRDEAIRFPLGWDIFLVGDGEVIGLPRTTQIEVL